MRRLEYGRNYRNDKVNRQKPHKSLSHHPILKVTGTLINSLNSISNIGR